MGTKFEPTVSVVISTRNRSTEIPTVIESIFANDYPNFEIYVVDQSHNDLTLKALQAYVSDSRVHYIKSSSCGCSTGRNIAIANTHSEFIAITDDDCVVPSNWLSQIMGAFKLDPCIGVVFGKVLAGEHDPTAGFIPAYILNKPYLARNLRQKNSVRGMSACMALRRSVWEEVKGFDQMLGAGSILKGASETDFAIKVLTVDRFVFETPSISVIHNGFRSWRDGRGLMFRYNYGTGAMLAKHLKRLKWSIVPVIGFELYCVIKTFLVNLIVKHRIRGLTPIVAFCRGFGRGLITPVDRSTNNFSQGQLEDKLSAKCFSE